MALGLFIVLPKDFVLSMFVPSTAVKLCANLSRRFSSSMAWSGAGSLGKQNFVQGVVQQPFDHFLVLDFEATCDDKTKPKPQVFATSLPTLNSASASAHL